MSVSMAPLSLEPPAEAAVTMALSAGTSPLMEATRRECATAIGHRVNRQLNVAFDAVSVGRGQTSRLEAAEGAADGQGYDRFHGCAPWRAHAAMNRQSAMMVPSSAPDQSGKRYPRE